MAVPSGLPRILWDCYQNVPQDVNFYAFDVPNKNNIGEIWGLGQFGDEKMSVFRMGGGDA